MKFSERNRSRCESKSGFNHKLNSWILFDLETIVEAKFNKTSDKIGYKICN